MDSQGTGREVASMPGDQAQGEALPDSRCPLRAAKQVSDAGRPTGCQKGQSRPRRAGSAGVGVLPALPSLPPERTGREGSAQPTPSQARSGLLHPSAGGCWAEVGRKGPLPSGRVCLRRASWPEIQKRPLEHCRSRPGRRSGCLGRTPELGIPQVLQHSSPSCPSFPAPLSVGATASCSSHAEGERRAHKVRVQAPP